MPEDEDGQRKTNSKAAILSSAVKHIGILEGENKRIRKERGEMERKFKGLERLVLEYGKELGVDVEVGEFSSEENEEKEQGVLREKIVLATPGSRVEKAILSSRLFTRRCMGKGS